MTTDTLGGVFTYSVQLIRALRDEDVEVVLATFGRRMSADQRRSAIEAGVTDPHDIGLALEWMPDPWDDLLEAEQTLLALERRERPDLVHLNAFAHGGAPFAAPVLVVGHSCVWSWWDAVHGENPPAPWDRYRALVREGLGGATAVVAPSQTMLGSLERWYGPLPARSVAIHNGTGHGAPAPGAVAKQPLVVSAGRLWDDAKNVGTLARIAQRPALRDRVLLAGEGAFASPGAGARRLGPLTPAALAEVRRAAAVYAAPARYEPFGLGILEAARDRCALVLGDIPSLREIWDDAAAYVAPDDDERLARTLEALLADPAAAARLGENAARRATRFTAPAMASAYRRLYDQISDEPPPGHAAPPSPRGRIAA